MVCALIPPEVLVTHKAPFFVFARGSEEDEAYLLGVLSSLCLDWYARRFVETSMAFFLLNGFPVPRPESTSPLRARTVELAARLASSDDRFRVWAGKAGADCGPLAKDEQHDMVAELDAVVAHLYGLSEAQLLHVYETFHDGWDYSERYHRTVKHYTEWSLRA